jgi:aarF domain-containing kinase
MSWAELIGTGVGLSLLTYGVYATTSPLLAESAVDAKEIEKEHLEQSEYQQLDEESVKKYAPTLEAQEEAHHRYRPSFIRSIQVVFVKYIAEPIGTAKRFLVLVCIFLPVLITMPMLFVGSRRETGRKNGRKVSKSEQGQRSGAIWWYSFLVKSLEWAGPTFIKVS